MTRLEELARKHFPLVAYDEALEFGQELIELCATVAYRSRWTTNDHTVSISARDIANNIRALAEEGK